MPGTFTKLLVHIVFSTKDREPLISQEDGERLHAYLGGIVRGEGCYAIAVGGVCDHVHLLVRLKPVTALADLMRILKSRSSAWASGELGIRGFAWQEGYAAFSVSRSQEAAVAEYIAKQPEHHAKTDFRTELINFLDAHGIDFEHRYLD